MRQRARNGNISVHAVAGTHVVLLGMDVAESAAAGLLGFTIERTNHTEGERFFLENPLLFAANDKGEASDRSTALNPVQAFVLGDYAAKPAHTYSYRVTAMRGTPDKLKPGPSVEALVTTEDPDDGEHGVFFNRGVAASSAYARRFGDVDPPTVPNRAAYAWLSRGLEEAIKAFIGRAVDGRFTLRAAMYEFKWAPVLDAFKVAADAGADVQIVYHAVPKTGDKTPAQNLVAIKAAQITAMCTKRVHTKIATTNSSCCSRTASRSRCGQARRTSPRAESSAMPTWGTGSPTSGSRRHTWTTGTNSSPTQRPKRSSVHETGSTPVRDAGVRRCSRRTATAYHRGLDVGHGGARWLVCQASARRSSGGGRRVVDVLADLIPAPALDGAGNPVYNRRQTTQRSNTVHARVSSYEGDVDRLIEGFERQADLVRGLDGFAHAYLLVDRAGSRAMIVAFWNSAEALDASASRAAHLREEASETAAATVGLVDSYEVALEVAGGAQD